MISVKLYYIFAIWSVYTFLFMKNFHEAKFGISVKYRCSRSLCNYYGIQEEILTKEKINEMETTVKKYCSDDKDYLGHNPLSQMYFYDRKIWCNWKPEYTGKIYLDIRNLTNTDWFIILLKSSMLGLATCVFTREIILS